MGDHPAQVDGIDRHVNASTDSFNAKDKGFWPSPKGINDIRIPIPRPLRIRG